VRRWMKVGQLLSIDAGDLLPPELAAILAGLRADARPMSQVVRAMEHSFGLDGEKHFATSPLRQWPQCRSVKPHAAITHGEPQLALTIQYPGIRHSIDRAVDNFATLLRTSRLVPEEPATRPLDCLALHWLSCA
jgi:hypothetical protein